MPAPTSPASVPARRPRIWPELAVLFAVPVVLLAVGLADDQLAGLLSIAAAAFALALMTWRTARRDFSIATLVPVLTMASLAAVGRIAFAPIPSFKPVTAICIVSGAAFGRHAGFAVGALAALVSNFFFGQGPWTVWQMYAWGFTGYLAGLLAHDAGPLLARPFARFGPALATFGAACALAFGFVMNCWHVVAFVRPLTWPSVVASFGAALPFDATHAAATIAFLAALYNPWIRKLDRVAARFAPFAAASDDAVTAPVDRPSAPDSPSPERR